MTQPADPERLRAKVFLKPRKRKIDSRDLRQAEITQPKIKRTTRPTDPTERPTSRLRDSLGLDKPKQAKSSPAGQKQAFVTKKKAFKRLTVDVSPETHKALMKHCLDIEQSMTRYVESLIETALESVDE